MSHVSEKYQNTHGLEALGTYLGLVRFLQEKEAGN